MAYTLADLQSAVQDDLKDPSFNATRITRYLNYAQDAIFNTNLFKFCEKSVAGSLTIGEYTYDQQSDWQTTIGGIVYDPSNTSVRLILDENSYLDHRDFFDSYPAPDLNPNALPSHWTEFGDQVYFNCPVDKTYTFKQRYYREAVDLTSPDDVPDVPKAFRELLEFYADHRSEKYRGNHDIAATYLQEFEDGLESMMLRFAETTQIGPVIMRNARSRIHV